MTETVLLFALLHAAPVMLWAWVTRNHASTATVAVVMGIVAVAIGRPAYMVVDLLAVGLGYWASATVILPCRKRLADARQPSAADAPSQPPSSGMRWLIGGAFGLALAVAYLHPRPSPTSTMPPAAPAAPDLSKPAGTLPAKQAPATKAAAPKSIAGNAEDEEARRRATIQDLRDSCRPPACRIND